MEFFEDVFKIIKEDGWRASVDLKDVFFTIPVHILHQKNFKSKSFIKFWKFLVMANRYWDAMRVFTKMLKPVLGYPRQQCHLSIVLFDDSYLQADIGQECIRNTNVTVDILNILENTWKKKSFNTNSKGWISWILDLLWAADFENKFFLSIPATTTQQLSSIMGLVTSLFPATPLGRLHCRVLEREWLFLLRKADGNFDAKTNSLNEFIKE